MSAKEKILAVDDDIAMLRLTEALLVEHYEVSLAKSGRQAVRFLEKAGCPDLILLDIDMPDMDGFETLLKIRESEKGGEIPIIYLTGLELAGCEARALTLGAVDFIRKPVEKDVLLARIALRLEQAKNRLELDVLRDNRESIGGLNPEKLLEMSQRLTKTEFAVAKLVAQGYTNEEISQQLSYSSAYVKKVVSRVFDRLDISRRSEVKRFFV